MNWCRMTEDFTLKEKCFYEREIASISAEFNNGFRQNNYLFQFQYEFVKVIFSHPMTFYPRHMGQCRMPIQSV